MRRLAILLLASLTIPATAAAQNPDVPLDLAKALIPALIARPGVRRPVE